MRITKHTLVYGLLVWLVPFVVGFLTFPLRTSDRPLFESIMAVALVFSVVFFAGKYFKTKSANDGLTTGVLWLTICIILDVLFLVGLFKTSLMDYLVIPIITTAFAKR
jgi:hypothetical protein